MNGWFALYAAVVFGFAAAIVASVVIELARRARRRKRILEPLDRQPWRTPRWR